MRAVAAGLILALAPTTAGLPVACPVDAKGAWAQGAALQAVTAGQQNVNVPRKGEGFNRTVSIDGFCTDAFTESSSFSCASAGGEFRATHTAVPASGVALRFGAASCPLSGVSIYKTSQAYQSKFEAEMRFEFEGCLNSPVTSAAVVIGLRKDPMADFNLGPWAQKVCRDATTTAAPAAVINFNTAATEYPVGSGMCSATVRRKIKAIKSESDCKLQCLSSSTKAHILNRTGCTGFAYNSEAKGENCITFSGSVLQAAPEPGWKCFNISYNQSQISKATPPPPVVIKDKTEILHMKEVLGLATAATLRQVQPPADQPNCFSPTWWFTLEDRLGEPVSAALKQAHWDELIGNQAAPSQPTAVNAAPQVLDRVLVEACTKSGWGGSEMCFAPAVEKTECRNEELTGAIIAGVITSILTWIMVAAWFCIYLRGFSSRAGYDRASSDESGQMGSRVCTHKAFQLGMCLVAAGGACLSCWLSMQFLDGVMRSTECYNFNEFLVVIIAVVLSVALAIIIFSLYLANGHPGHAHPYLHETTKTERKNTKLMLVEVPDGAAAGSMMGQSVESMVGTKQGFQSQNSPFGTMQSSGSPNATGGSAW